MCRIQLLHSIFDDFASQDVEQLAGWLLEPAAAITGPCEATGPPSRGQLAAVPAAGATSAACVSGASAGSVPLSCPPTPFCVAAPWTAAASEPSPFFADSQSQWPCRRGLPDLPSVVSPAQPAAAASAAPMPGCDEQGSAALSWLSGWSRLAAEAEALDCATAWQLLTQQEQQEQAQQQRNQQRQEQRQQFGLHLAGEGSGAGGGSSWGVLRAACLPSPGPAGGSRSTSGSAANSSYGGAAAALLQAKLSAGGASSTAGGSRKRHAPTPRPTACDLLATCDQLSPPPAFWDTSKRIRC